MADKYINEVGLRAIKAWIEGKFALNTAIPTATSDLTNDGDGTSDFATKEYVDENGGKIDVIKVNGNEQTITNKEVDLNVPMTTYRADSEGISGNFYIGDLETGSSLLARIYKNDNFCQVGLNDADGNVVMANIPTTDAIADFQTATQVQDAIDASLEDITGIDFQVVTTLPAAGEHGVIYLVHKDGESGDIYDEYIWVTPSSGTAHFEKIGTTDIDLSEYWAKTELVAMTTAEINAILNPSS